MGLTPIRPWACMQELIAIQQNGPKELGFFGTRNMGFLHQNLIEILSYAMVLTVSPPLRGVPSTCNIHRWHSADASTCPHKQAT